MLAARVLEGTRVILRGGRNAHGSRVSELGSSALIANDATSDLLGNGAGSPLTLFIITSAVGALAALPFLD